MRCIVPCRGRRQQQNEEERREAIISDSVRYSEEGIKLYTKTKEEEENIKRAISENEFLRNATTPECLQKIVDAMEKKQVKENEIIISEGQRGEHLYISDSGWYEIIVNNEVKTVFNHQRVFGELAILYGQKRSATVKATQNGYIWCISRRNYRKILAQEAEQKEREYLQFLKNVPAFSGAHEESLVKIANLFKKVFFAEDQVIVNENEKGDKFYIVKAGTAAKVKTMEGKIGTFAKVDFFGEDALQDKTTAYSVVANTPGVECLVLEKQEFLDCLGTLEEMIHGAKELYGRPSDMDSFSKYSNIKLDDLKRIKTVGKGAFGRVELVQHIDHQDWMFALKYMKKIEIVGNHAQQQARAEKEIHLACKSMFIVKLYKTFKDAGNVYFLMEYCPNGDLWNMLYRQRNKGFSEPTSKFISACVLEALGYLHDRNYIFRDLKPENLVIDDKGYIKLTDFGSAKNMANLNRTYTFCGTPVYCAPEKILTHGHNKAADYWALGILIFELFTRRTPFDTKDPTNKATYEKIMSGIENVDFPETIPKSAQSLIKQLCKGRQTTRIGCQKNGVQDIRNHSWFSGFEWSKLYTRRMKSPISLKSKVQLPKFREDLEPTIKETSGWDEDF